MCFSAALLPTYSFTLDPSSTFFWVKTRSDRKTDEARPSRMMEKNGERTRRQKEETREGGQAGEI